MPVWHGVAAMFSPHYLGVMSLNPAHAHIELEIIGPLTNAWHLSKNKWLLSFFFTLKT